MSCCRFSRTVTVGLVGSVAWIAMAAHPDTAMSAMDSVHRRAAFADLYSRHVHEVYRYVHRRCQDVALAEDVTQDTFLTAVRSVPDPDEIGIGWLKRVARNCLVDVLRRRSRYSGMLRLVHSGTTELDAEAALVEQMRVQEALERLDVVQRLVLTLHYLDGMTIPALAEELGRSPKAIESLVTRARRRLREELVTDRD